MLPNRCHEGHQALENPVIPGFFWASEIIPTRRVKSISKLFCIEDLIRRDFI